MEDDDDSGILVEEVLLMEFRDKLGRFEGGKVSGIEV
jgi:hypothetical protein